MREGGRESWKHLTARQLAAHRQSRAHGYLSLSYENTLEAQDRRVFAPVVELWEHALFGAGAAVIVVESFAETGLSQVSFSAAATPARLRPGPLGAVAARDLETLVAPVRGAVIAETCMPVQVWWFTRDLPSTAARKLAERAATIDRRFSDARFPDAFLALEQEMNAALGPSPLETVPDR